MLKKIVKSRFSDADLALAQMLAESTDPYDLAEQIVILQREITDLKQQLKNCKQRVKRQKWKQVKRGSE